MRKSKKEGNIRTEHVRKSPHPRFASPKTKPEPNEVVPVLRGRACSVQIFDLGSTERPQQLPDEFKRSAERIVGSELPSGFEIFL